MLFIYYLTVSLLDFLPPSSAQFSKDVLILKEKVQSIYQIKYKKLSLENLNILDRQDEDRNIDIRRQDIHQS